jgi:hypothetical protein
MMEFVSRKQLLSAESICALVSTFNFKVSYFHDFQQKYTDLDDDFVASGHCEILDPTQKRCVCGLCPVSGILNKWKTNPSDSECYAPSSEPFRFYLGPAILQYSTVFRKTLVASLSAFSCGSEQKQLYFHLPYNPKMAARARKIFDA